MLINDTYDDLHLSKVHATLALIRITTKAIILIYNDKNINEHAYLRGISCVLSCAVPTHIVLILIMAKYDGPRGAHLICFAYMFGGSR